jgi:hypothetical protein
VTKTHDKQWSTRHNEQAWSEEDATAARAASLEGQRDRKAGALDGRPRDLYSELVRVNSALRDVLGPLVLGSASTAYLASKGGAFLWFRPVERPGGPLVHIQLRVTPRHVKVHVHLRVDTALHTARHGRFKQRSRGHRD